MHMLHNALRSLTLRSTLQRRVPFPARPKPCLTATVKPSIRYFSVSSPRHAEEDNTRVSEALAKSFDMSKITENPSIVEALISLSQIAKEEGIDMNSRPSMPVMIKMATNARIKTAILNVQEQFEAAGINLTKEKAFDIFNNLKAGDR